MVKGWRWVAEGPEFKDWTIIELRNSIHPLRRWSSLSILIHGASLMWTNKTVDPRIRKENYWLIDSIVLDTFSLFSMELFAIFKTHYNNYKQLSLLSQVPGVGYNFQDSLCKEKYVPYLSMHAWRIQKKSNRRAIEMLPNVLRVQIPIGLNLPLRNHVPIEVA